MNAPSVDSFKNRLDKQWNLYTTTKQPHRRHTDPVFKRNNIVKVSDLYKLQVFSFMHDLVNSRLPGSFDDFVPITNESNYDITTRQCNRLYITWPRTTFSSNLPNHNFANIWNEFDQIYQKCKQKTRLRNLYVKIHRLIFK